MFPGTILGEVDSVGVSLLYSVASALASVRRTSFTPHPRHSSAPLSPLLQSNPFTKQPLVLSWASFRSQRGYSRAKNFISGVAAISLRQLHPKIAPFARLGLDS